MIHIQFVQDPSRLDMRLPGIPRHSSTRRTGYERGVECLSEHATCRPERQCMSTRNTTRRRLPHGIQGRAVHCLSCDDL